MITVMALVVIIANLMVVFVPSISPGIQIISSQTFSFPMSYGFATTFGMSMKQALVLILLPAFSGVFSLMYGYSRQVYSISTSGLLPSIFALVTSENDRPYVALVVGNIITFCGVEILNQCSTNTLYIVFSFITLMNKFVYISIFCCYLQFSNSYSMLQRSFRSPVGVYGAYYGIVISILQVISAAFLQKGNYRYLAIVTVVAVFIIISGYYYLHARKHHKFSPEEQTVMFSAYVINGK